MFSSGGGINETLSMAMWKFRPILVGNLTIPARLLECNTAPSWLFLLLSVNFNFHHHI